jgi:hypothetical protein
MTKDNRPLSARLDAYIANLASIADQTENLADNIDAIKGPASTTPLRDGIRLYRIVIDDLTKVINGEQLEPFSIEGEI